MSCVTVPAKRGEGADIRPRFGGRICCCVEQQNKNGDLMAVKITIEKLKHIKKLEFTIPGAGVWLLTGANGTGKTSLLACMRRIGDSNAFPQHFRSSAQSNQLDSFAGATVKYEINGEHVKYRYVKTRWAPQPRPNAALLRQAGYPSVRYIAADADRIEPRKEDFKPRRVRGANADLIAAANTIFDTTRFNSLKTINLQAGPGNEAFLMELPARPGERGAFYASEKNFSLGELCILKLLRILKDCANGTLVLIDELELALHPTAQVELVRHLNAIARDKNLTIVVSTHSATLIKQTHPSRLLFLQKDDAGDITCHKGCFPSYVLGVLAYREEAVPDVIVYVEDKAAKAYLDQLVVKVKERRYTQMQPGPVVQTIPVGGINEVLRFFVRQRPLLPMITRSYVVLDEDAQQSLEDAQVADIVQIRDTYAEYISYLTITPEVGLAKFLHDHTRDARDQLRSHYNVQLVLTAGQVGALPMNVPPEQERSHCKDLVDRVCLHIAGQLPNIPDENVKETLLKILANHDFAANIPRQMQWLMPILQGR